VYTDEQRSCARTHAALSPDRTGAKTLVAPAASPTDAGHTFSPPGPDRSIRRWFLLP